MRWSVLFLSLLFVASAAAQQVVIEDPAGDVEHRGYTGPQPAVGEWNAVDMRAITVTETEDAFLWAVQVEGLAAQTGGQCPQAGDLRSYFTYGRATYNVQQGMGPDCSVYAFFFETFGSDFNRRFIGQLEVALDTEAPAVVATLPKEFVVDDAGAPPIAGRYFEDVYARSFSQFSIGGPDPNNPFGFGGTDAATTTDDMPDDREGGRYEIQVGGIQNEGQVKVWSEVPYRSSNGGEAVFVYDVEVQNQATNARTFSIELMDVPSNWRSGLSATELTLPGGESATVQAVVETPFGHQHGGGETFHAHVRDVADAATWGTAQLGVNYLAVPQPTGHHDTLHVYTQPFQDPFTTTFIGGDGEVWMNTLPEFEGDSGEAVDAFQVDGQGGSKVGWFACLDSDLRLGIDADLDAVGEAVLNIEATRLYPGASLDVRVIHLAPGPTIQYCHPFFYGDREATVIAAADTMELGDLNGAVNAALEMRPDPAADFIPYQAGAAMVMEITITHGAVNGVGPSSVALQPGASVRLPLLEYFDERPAGVIAGQASADNDTAEEVLEGPAPTDGAADSPLPMLVLVGAIALALRRR